MSYDLLVREFAAEDKRRNRERLTVTREDAAQMSRRTMRLIIVGITGMFSAYLVLCIALAWHQTSLVYWNTDRPMSQSIYGNWRIEQYPSNKNNVEFAAYVHSGKPGAPTVIYLHGRGESMAIASHTTNTYIQRGWSVIIPEYPGFAGLKGSPSEENIDDFMRVLHHALIADGKDPEMMVIHGNSLGAGPALQLAQHAHGFLLLTAPVGSMAEVVGTYVPYYPTFLLRDKWDNFERAKSRYPVPAQVVIAANDTVVSPDQGRRLAKAAGAALDEHATGGHWMAGRGAHLRLEDHQFRYRNN